MEEGFLDALYAKKKARRILLGKDEITKWSDEAETRFFMALSEDAHYVMLDYACQDSGERKVAQVLLDLMGFPSDELAQNDRHPPTYHSCGTCKKMESLTDTDTSLMGDPGYGKQYTVPLNEVGDEVDSLFGRASCITRHDSSGKLGAIRLVVETDYLLERQAMIRREQAVRRA